MFFFENLAFCEDFFENKSKPLYRAEIFDCFVEVLSVYC